MTENTENLTLQHWRELCNDIPTLSRRMDEGFSQVNQRLTLIEHRLGTMDRSHAEQYLTYAAQSERIDQLQTRIERIERIERRLEMSD